MWWIKFDISECHNGVDIEAVSLCPLSRYDTIRNQVKIRKICRTSADILCGRPRLELRNSDQTLWAENWHNGYWGAFTPILSFLHLFEVEARIWDRQANRRSSHRIRRSFKLQQAEGYCTWSWVCVASCESRAERTKITARNPNQKNEVSTVVFKFQSSKMLA